MSVLEQLVRIFAPHTCLGCGAEMDGLLCSGCAESLTPVASRCYRCHATTDGYRVCRNCVSRTPLRQMAVFTHHRSLAKELLHRMKYERAQAGIHEAAALMAPLLASLPEDVVLVHIPTATSRVRSRGYDHARLLARSLSAQSGLPRLALLGRTGQAHQVGAARTQRLQQLHGAFRPVHADAIRGRHIVLVDDVLTTGATLETAAHVLKAAGAAHVSAIVFAQA